MRGQYRLAEPPVYRAFAKLSYTGDAQPCCAPAPNPILLRDGVRTGGWRLARCDEVPVRGIALPVIVVAGEYHGPIGAKPKRVSRAARNRNRNRHRYRYRIAPPAHVLDTAIRSPVAITFPWLVRATVCRYPATTACRSDHPVTAHCPLRLFPAATAVPSARRDSSQFPPTLEHRTPPRFVGQQRELSRAQGPRACVANLRQYQQRSTSPRPHTALRCSSRRLGPCRPQATPPCVICPPRSVESR